MTGHTPSLQGKLLNATSQRQERNQSHASSSAEAWSRLTPLGLRPVKALVRDGARYAARQNVDDHIPPVIINDLA